MLFIQSLSTYYEKQERSSEYARLRSDDLFRGIDCSKIKKCEVFVQFLSLRYDKEKVSSAKIYREQYRQYGESIFTEGIKDPYASFNKLIPFIRIFRDEEMYRIMFCEKNPNYEYKQLLDLR